MVQHPCLEFGGNYRFLALVGIPKIQLHLPLEIMIDLFPMHRILFWLRLVATPSGFLHRRSLVTIRGRHPAVVVGVLVFHRVLGVLLDGLVVPDWLLRYDVHSRFLVLVYIGVLDLHDR